jgi:hypothetical protein
MNTANIKARRSPPTAAVVITGAPVQVILSTVWFVAGINGSVSWTLSSWNSGRTSMGQVSRPTVLRIDGRPAYPITGVVHLPRLTFERASSPTSRFPATRKCSPRPAFLS